MAIVFVVASEKQFQSGIAWCKRLAGKSGRRTSIHVIVADPDRKTLAEYVRHKLSDQSNSLFKYQTALVPKKVRDVLAYASSVDCEKLLLIYHPEQSDFQLELFKESMCAAMWLRFGSERSPPKGRILRIFEEGAKVTDEASRELLGDAPAETMEVDSKDSSNGLAESIDAAMAASAVTADDLILCGVEDPHQSDRVFKSGLALLKQHTEASVALVHTGDTLVESVAGKLRSWGESVAPLMERQHRIDLSKELQTGSQPNWEYLGLISASSMLAAFGLLQDSAAVIIGAMLIAPLMTPILGAGLALTQGNRPLFKTALTTITLGFAGALGASMAFGWLFWIFRDPVVTPEMWARCRPSPLDFCVGLVGGLAASYARTRTHLSGALAGAAIAAALVPPIATAGLQIAFGFWKATELGTPVTGPLLLVTVNVLMIMIGSSFVLWFRGMRVDRTLAKRDRWVLRVFAMLAVLVALILTGVVLPQ